MDAQDMFKHSLLRNFHSDNIIVNTIITGMIVTITSYLFSKLSNLKTVWKKIIKLLSFQKDRTSELEFTCDEITSYYAGTKMTGSINFKALLWLIREKIKEDKIEGLKFIKEFNEKCDDYDDDDDDIGSFSDDILYIVNQEEEFVIYDDEYEDINFQFTTIENNSSDDNRNSKTQVSHSIALFSRTKPLQYLQKY